MKAAFHRFVLLILTLLLTGAGLAVAAPAQALARVGSLTASRTTAILGEKVTFRGSVPPRAARPVLLQRAAGSRWVKVAAARTSRAGTYAFTVRAASSATRTAYRVYAPRTRIGRKSAAAVVTPTRVVATTRQAAALSMATREYVNKELIATAKFTPARPGRVVTLSQYASGRWVSIATGTQSPTGVATLRLTGIEPASVSFRATTSAAGGAVAATTATRTVTFDADPVTVAPTAEPLSSAEADAIGSFTAPTETSTGTLTFAADAPTSIASIVPGDVVAVPPRPGLGSGALVKIATRVVNPDGTTTLGTTPATLPQVVTNVPDDATQVAMPLLAPVTVSDVSEGVTVTQMAAARTMATRTAARAAGVNTLSVDGPQLDAQVDATLKTEVNGTPVTVNLIGSSTLTPTIDFDFDMDWFHLKSYRVGAGVQVEDKFTATATAANDGEWSRDLFTVHATRGGMIGTVPVWATFTGVVTVHASAAGEVKASVTWKRTGEFTAGVKGERSDDYTPHPYKREATGSAYLGSVDASGDLAGDVTATAQLDMYSLAGPFLDLGYEVSGHAEAHIGTDASHSYSCELWHRPKMAVGLRTSALLKEITEKSHTLARKDFDFAKHMAYECPVPKPTINTSHLPDAVVGATYGTRLAARNEPAGTWSVVGGALPEGITLADPVLGNLAGTPTGPAGDYPVRVKFTMTGGGSSTADLVLKVVAVATMIQVDVSDAGTSCGRDTDGRLWCWGANSAGQFGNGRSVDSPIAIPAGGVGTYDAFTMGYEFGCGIRTGSGSLWCWGRNEQVQTGVPMSGTPTVGRIRSRSTSGREPRSAQSTQGAATRAPSTRRRTCGRGTNGAGERASATPAPRTGPAPVTGT